MQFYVIPCLKESLALIKSEFKEEQTGGELISSLEEVISKGIRISMVVVIMDFDYLNMKQKECNIISTACSLKHMGTKAVQWTYVKEVQPNNKVTVFDGPAQMTLEQLTLFLISPNIRQLPVIYCSKSIIYTTYIVFCCNHNVSADALTL